MAKESSVRIPLDFENTFLVFHLGHEKKIPPPPNVLENIFYPTSLIERH